MFHSLKPAIAAASMLFAASAAHADEAAFLNSLRWKLERQGNVKVRTNSSPINVTCTFNSDATESSLSLDGNCRGLVIVSRAIGADLKANGAKYSGSYVGAAPVPRASAAAVRAMPSISASAGPRRSMATATRG